MQDTSFRIDPQRYVKSGVPDTVPPGHRLVHNHIYRDATTPVGTRGFRAWIVPDDVTDPPLLECGCGWAPAVPVHYRVDLEAARAR